jgi:hypothetical protein
MMMLLHAPTPALLAAALVVVVFLSARFVSLIFYPVSKHEI